MMIAVSTSSSTTNHEKTYFLECSCDTHILSEAYWTCGISLVRSQLIVSIAHWFDGWSQPFFDKCEILTKAWPVTTLILNTLELDRFIYSICLQDLSLIFDQSCCTAGTVVYLDGLGEKSLPERNCPWSVGRNVMQGCPSFKWPCFEAHSERNWDFWRQSIRTILTLYSHRSWKAQCWYSDDHK